MTNRNVFFTTLGCSKNDVDTDLMRTILEGREYNTVFMPEEADIIIINTCGFIESAKQESIDEILEMSEYVKDNDKKLLVSGCLAQRYSDELLEEIPEIDGILGTGQYRNIEEYIKKLEKGNRVKAIEDINSPFEEGYYKSNVESMEYVKIAEGCNNFCSYCIIPKLRGKNRSREIENIYKEVEELVKKGAREVILIAQNTTDYGIDLYKKYALSELLNRLEEIEDLKWIRVMYLYPDNFNDNLIESFKNNKKLLPYVDIPLQHVNDEVLKNMNRRTNKKDIVQLIEKLRREIPDMVIRSTFIIGFPGETEEQFLELMEFLEEVRLDKVGVFAYSQEENTPAYSMENQVPEEIKLERLGRIMELQESISEKNMEKYIGKIFEIIIEEIDSNALVGRTYMDAPDIDGVTYVNGNYSEKYDIGDFVKVKIVDTMAHDMIGELI